MPASEHEGHHSPSEFSTAQSSLLRLSRRHSLPASAAGVSGILSFWAQNSNNSNNHSEGVGGIPIHGNGQSPVVVPYRRPNLHMRSSSVLVNGTVPVNGGVGSNGHHRGHRHTRSENLDQPVIVKSYNPDPAAPCAVPIEEEEDDDCQLPSIDDFSFDGILKAVDPEVTRALDGVSELCSKYQESVRAEVVDLTSTQTQLDARIKETDKLATQVLKATRSRSDRLEAETAGLKGGSVVDRLAEATEATHAAMTSIISTLLAIDEMLPPQERLSPENSAHRKHYPELHTLLVSKATELNLCFGSGRAGSSHNAHVSEVSVNGDSVSQKQDTLKATKQRRRLSSASQHVFSNAMKRSSTFSENRPQVVSPPQLQLRTILPSAAADSPKIVESSKGSYFPLAPQTATGVSLTTPFATAQTSEQSTQSRRGSGIWPRRPSTSTLAFFPIDERESISNNSMANFRPPPTPSKRLSWRGSGTWSGFGGLFGNRSSRGSNNDSRRERAEDKLKAVLESEGTSKGKGVGV
ncbi:hypothetical protein EDC01DRAFT_667396 [Geopyxis carbonaria]|nr:hypothetical protein EDC01DRAFT_667396 [Geopyxis carbonaria]